MKKVMGFTKLIRPINCLLMGFAVVVGVALAGGENVPIYPTRLLLGFSTSFLLCGAAMVINDYYDREIDAINEPMRPIPEGTISPTEALVFASVLTVIGLSVAVLTGRVPNWQCLTLAIISWLITILYVTKGKEAGLLGNLMVSTCISVPFIYGAFVVEAGLLSTTVIFVAIIFLSNTGREITKGIVDVQGDKCNDIRTVAVSFGEKKASIVAAFFYLSAVLLTPIPLLLDIVSFWYVPFVVLTDVGMIVASLLLVLNPSKENARTTKNRNLLWFFTGLLAFVVGALG